MGLWSVGGFEVLFIESLVAVGFVQVVLALTTVSVWCFGCVVVVIEWTAVVGLVCSLLLRLSTDASSGHGHWAAGSELVYLELRPNALFLQGKRSSLRADGTLMTAPWPPLAQFQALAVKKCGLSQKALHSLWPDLNLCQ